MVDFIMGTVKFFDEYITQILLAVMILCLITVYLITNDIVIKERKSHLVKKVTVETFENPFEQNLFYDPNKRSALAFDELCKKDPYKCDEMCNSLINSEVCNSSNSCVWVHDKENNEKCVAGNHLGATFNPLNYIKTFFNNKEVKN